MAGMLMENRFRDYTDGKIMERKIGYRLDSSVFLRKYSSHLEIESDKVIACSQIKWKCNQWEELKISSTRINSSYLYKVKR